MTTFLILAMAVFWLNLGILAARAMNELDGATPLEEMVLPLRLVVILLAPIGLLIFERHLFYSRREGLEAGID